MAKWARRILAFIRRGRLLDELAEEMETHRALRQHALERDGVEAARAATESRRVMGNATLAHEDARDVWTVAAFDHLRRDLTYGLRTLRREPTFAVAAIATLALGLATVTSIFSIVDAEVWKPLPFPDADRLVAIRAVAPGERGWTERISGADFLDWQAQSRSFDSLAGHQWTSRHVLQRETAESVLVTAVTSEFFQTLGVTPALGRGFGPEDARGSRAVILTDGGWRRLFNADGAALGHSIVLDGQHTTIVGILSARDSQFLEPDDLVSVIDETSPEFRDRRSRSIDVIGRLRPDVELGAAQAELNAIDRRITGAFPEGREGRSVRLSDLRDDFDINNWRPLYFFLGAAVIVLALSCVNVANLLLARALRRQREFAIRGALGGGRRALVRQLLVEGALIAAPGAAAGLLLAKWALAFFSTRIPEEYLQPGRQVPLDARVFLFAFTVTAVTAIVFGLVPALFARRVNLNLTLGQGGRTAGSPAHARARRTLLIAQIAITLVLTAGAGLFVQSFVALTRVPLGFDPHGRLSLRVILTGPRYEDDAALRRYAEQMLERARATPGVQEAAIGSSSPLASGPIVRFVRPDRALPAAGDEPYAILRAVDPAFFTTLGIRLIAGRGFTSSDVPGAPRVAVINEYLGQQLFPGEDPIGRVLEFSENQRTPWARRPGTVVIVGIASNVKEVGLNEVEFKDIYVPYAQMPAPSIELLVNAATPRSVAPVLRASAGSLDPALPITSLSTLDDRVHNALDEDRFNLLLISSFAAIGIVLAAVGIYGAVAYAVEERTREFGVRLALGARPRAIVMSALGQAARLGIVGGAIGLAATLVAARLLGNALYLVRGEHNGVLYGVTTTDPLALSTAFVAIVIVAVLSGAAPARAVSRVDPLAALRQE